MNPTLNTSQRTIIRAVDSSKSYAERICSELVRTNTVNPYAGGPAGNETDGQLILQRELKGLGFTTELFECPPNIYKRTGILGPTHRSHAGRMNLVAQRTLRQPGKTVVINGHMDTVGITDMTIAPFSGTLKNGRIMGRGACDCKGGLTGGLVAVKALVETGVLDRGAIIFESVIDEECSGCGAGTIACCLAGHGGDFCIMLDGTADSITVECLGVVTGKISVTGQGGHAVERQAISALDMACLVKEELDRVKARRLAGHRQTSFCIGQFSAGTAPWTIPSDAHMAFNMSYPIDEARKAEKTRGAFNGILAREMVEQALARARQSHPWLRAHPPKIEWIKDMIPYQTDRRHPLTQAVAKAYRQTTRKKARITVESGWSDATWAARLGRMPTVAFGTARPGAAHAPDEWVAVADILTQAKVVALAVTDLTAAE
ncbi:MAG: M20/M25/M40 family metallo-hydrolase [Verrucomicrobia bacterium]|nr:M20/M25/M40 family metallo-hydrolase [Verrucomicrobiota bacterium]MBU4290141.1 M20/M25/M40 family metallo-hydrolase [Verrucomicrobiota bacterium]MBU4429386.1 M20/M25/M40 family metallo-hydrolase [Verrucomicrobiota bacterium]MCG2681455.1 M20/M25/M40 family metallo-hydrolase [Kiritimatiellia bacterium]